jgi:hypothetical protein
MYCVTEKSLFVADQPEITQLPSPYVIKDTSGWLVLICHVTHKNGTTYTWQLPGNQKCQETDTALPTCTYRPTEDAVGREVRCVATPPNKHDFMASLRPFFLCH